MTRRLEQAAALPAVLWVANTTAAVQYADGRVMLRRGATTVADGHPLQQLYPDLFSPPKVTTWPCARCGVVSSAPLCPEHHPALVRRRGRVHLADLKEAR